jgi:hypothetical protein
MRYIPVGGEERACWFAVPIKVRNGRQERSF